MTVLDRPDLVVADWHGEDRTEDRWVDRMHGIELVSHALRETRRRFDEWMRRVERSR